MARLATKILVTLEELSLLKEEWTTLIKTTNTDNIFLTWDWIYVWCKHYLCHAQLCVILFYDERQRLVGIAPCYIQSSRILGAVKLKTLRFLGTEEVCPAYLDFITSDKYRKDVITSFYELLYGELTALWDVALLSDMPAESLSIDYLGALSEHDGKVFEISDPVGCPTIMLPNSTDDFLASIGRSERYNLQRKKKRLAGAGAVSWERITASPDFAKAMDSFIWLHQARWEGKGEAGAFKRPRFEAFHREIGNLFAEKQMSCIDLLKLDGEAIAGIYGYQYLGRYYYYLPGFNHNMVSEASPGTSLLFRCVELAIANGLSEFDLLRGIMPYKLAWANGLRRCITLKVYNRGFRAVASKCYGDVHDFMKVIVR